MESSGNFSGAANPAIDAMITKMTSAKTKAELLPACHALERIVAHSHYLLPAWTAGTHRVVYNARRLAMPGQMPPYAPGEIWIINTWWKK